jgi:hypothetical protein
LAQIPSLDRMPKIERRADCIADPVERLRYLRLMTTPERKLLRPGRWRPAGWIALAAALVLSPGPRPKSAAGTFQRDRGLIAPAWSQNVAASASAQIANPSATRAPEGSPTAIPHVWRVERSGSSELYSNGLRVDLTFRISNRPRAPYPIFSFSPAPMGRGSSIAPTLTGWGWSASGTGRGWKTGSTPVGIVYHTTESLIAPFEEDQNRRLKQLGRNLIDVIRGERAYHYLIDRFGRVFAAVAESDAANHAGKSVWADAQGIYVNLNDSFLGVAFEAQTGAAEAVTPAQIVAGKALTEMLRSRYGIAAGNCVTHAQVSVNPENMRIGSHTDWASDFPFAALGLPDNYAVPLASMYAFGFDYDAVFLRVAGGRWSGLNLAEERMAKQAAAEGIPMAQYRARLRRRYKDVASELDTTELASSGFGATLLGTSGLGTTGLAASRLGTTGLGTTGLGASRLGTTGLGTTGLALSGLGKAGRGTAGRVSTAIKEAVAEEVAK